MPAINYERLANETDEIRARFADGDPIRHVLIEDFLDAQKAQLAARAFPTPDAMEIAFAGLPEVKNAEQRIDRLDPVFQSIFHELRSPRFITWLAEVTQIPHLFADPELHGGGLHQGSDGSYLDIHADFNIHPQLGIYRRLNVLIYLNERWEPKWQGYLELWSRDMRHCRQSIEPKFNRCVIMETHDHAFHGYKELHLPAGVTRRSLASYYYSAQRSEAQTEDKHDTLFQLRPEQQRATGARQFFRRLTALAPKRLRPVVRALRTVLRINE
ncbi:MAG: 2OG-Fe(II) oxygenase [Candidatus Eremiobacteraeota bacterium]|nr:2OG-Fe(II) oxygenase [Candidatus Eremiobacteraeota bacterium]